MKLKRERDPGLKEAIKVAGSLTALGAAIGLTPQAVARWESVPLKRVLEVSRATGVPRQVLRPDYWFEDAPEDCHV
jgi:DNA-binding transcriptional regulator YdaS (Cro superfamily)